MTDIADILDWLDTLTDEWVLYIKRLSSNDTGLTGGHQVGIYIPKDVMQSVFPEIQRLDIENPDYQFIEFDIQYTKDKVIVVYHDLTLSRLQNKNVRIDNVTYAELEEISDYHIPTYDEVMDIIGDSKKINVEVKGVFIAVDKDNCTEKICEDFNIIVQSLFKIEIINGKVNFK